MTTIITKNSSTASAVPLSGDLEQGELAVNVTDKKLYTKDSGGTVVKVVGSLGNQEASAVAITGGTEAGVAITGGTINNTPVGATTANTVRGTTVTATTGFVGDLTGNVTGNVTGAVTGNVTGNITGNVTGNVTASSGTSTFNNVTINGTLDMNSGSAGTVTGLAAPTNASDAATKSYVDTSISNLVDSAPGALDTLNELAAALGDDANFSTTITNSIATKVSKAGDTMSGALAMGTNKITGLGTPTAGTDASTKDYVDTVAATKLNLAGGTMTGNIVMGANKVTSTATPTTDDDLTRKAYVDSILGSATSAATSAAAAATSETNAANSASAAASSATASAASASAAAASYDAFDDRYLGAKSSAPTLDNDGNALLTGALYYDTTASEVRVYTGTGWVAAGSAVNGTSNRETYTATSGQTVFNITYDVGYVDVYLNGVKLVAGTDFTATSGTDVTLSTGATAGDIVDMIAFGAFVVANTYTQAAADAKFLQVNNNLSDLGSAATARTNLGLVIGTDVQAYDANITTASNTQTLTNKTVTNIVLDGSSTEEVFALGTSGSLALNPANGTVQTCALTGNPTFTDSLSTGQSLLLMLNNGASYTVTWPTVTWTSFDGNVAPTLTAADTLVFWKVATTLYGAYAGSRVTP